MDIHLDFPLFISTFQDIALLIKSWRQWKLIVFSKAQFQDGILFKIFFFGIVVTSWVNIQLIHFTVKVPVQD